MREPEASGTVDLAVVILTFNEEIHIERAINSVRHLAREIVIVDSFSTDRTIELARALGAKTVQNPFVTQARQFQWALNSIPLKSAWIMRLDADEIVEPDLAEEIRNRLPRLAEPITGVNLRRKHIFMGRWIKHGGRYPLTMLRIWRRGTARVEDRWMDEHMIIESGETVTFDGGFADVNLKDLTAFTAKHNNYATREAVQILLQRVAFRHPGALTARNASRQAFIKRFFKENLYNRVPFQVAAPAYFIWRYLFQLGFLDGIEGLIYHVLQGLWYRLLVGAKLAEMKRAVGDVRDTASAKQRLTAFTGLRID
jgi:glycosyltransferase involved in cell wall biosynthesis